MNSTTSPNADAQLTQENSPNTTKPKSSLRDEALRSFISTCNTYKTAAIAEQNVNKQMKKMKKRFNKKFDILFKHFGLNEE